MAESVTATSECSPGFSPLRVWQLPAPTTRLRQVLLCVDKPASSTPLELTGAHCHGHSPLHQLNTGQAGAHKPCLELFSAARRKM